MAKRKSFTSNVSKNKTESSSNIPFLTGVFANFHTGSFVNCDANDNSFFCNFTKVFSGIMMLITLLLVLYIIYYFSKIYFSKKK